MRSKLLMTLLRMGLLVRDVKNHVLKQLKQQRNKGRRDGDHLFKTGKQRMQSKLSDSRRDEEHLRKERNSLRSKFESMVPKNVYASVMKRLKSKVQRIKLSVKKKNMDKISRYKMEKDAETLDELSSLKEEMGEFGDLRIFRGITIQPEGRKPTVTSKEVILSKDEEEVVSRNPKFAVRSMMSKERFMVEVEKGLCKKQYADIGKEVVAGVTVEELALDKEDKGIMREAEWQGRKSEMPYDFEMKDLDLGRLKATGMKGNKRVTLPKTKDVQAEALREVRSKRAAEL